MCDLTKLVVDIKSGLPIGILDEFLWYLATSPVLS